MNSTPLILKNPKGWFAAGAEIEKALTLLSDGAFKLFVYLCLNARRDTGGLETTQTELARGLRKGTASLRSYLREMETAGVCRSRFSRSPASRGRIEVTEAFWPYRKPESEKPDPAAEAFVGTLKKLLQARPCIQSAFSTADEILARHWFQSGVSLQRIERALLCSAAFASTPPGAITPDKVPSVVCVTSNPSSTSLTRKTSDPTTGTISGFGSIAWRNSGTRTVIRPCHQNQLLPSNPRRHIVKLRLCRHDPKKGDDVDDPFSLLTDVVQLSHYPITPASLRSDAGHLPRIHWTTSPESAGSKLGGVVEAPQARRGPSARHGVFAAADDQLGAVARGRKDGAVGEAAVPGQDQSLQAASSRIQRLAQLPHQVGEATRQVVLLDLRAITLPLFGQGLILWVGLVRPVGWLLASCFAARAFDDRDLLELDWQGAATDTGAPVERHPQRGLQKAQAEHQVGMKGGRQRIVLIEGRPDQTAALAQARVVDGHPHPSARAVSQPALQDRGKQLLRLPADAGMREVFGAPVALGPALGPDDAGQGAASQANQRTQPLADRQERACGNTGSQPARISSQ